MLLIASRPLRASCCSTGEEKRVTGDCRPIPGEGTIAIGYQIDVFVYDMDRETEKV